MWTRLGISCPAGLLRAEDREKRKVPEEDPAEIPEFENRFLFAHGRAKVKNSALAQAQMAILLELSRLYQTDAVGRKGPKISLPAEIVREAVRQGSRSPELGLWVAAAAAALAVGVRFGPGAVQRVPRLLAPRGSGFAMHFQAPTFRGLKKRADGVFAGFEGSGDTFQGLLG